MKAYRFGANWKSEDDQPLVWNDGFFMNPVTGECFELVERKSEDEIVVE